MSELADKLYCKRHLLVVMRSGGSWAKLLGWAIKLIALLIKPISKHIWLAPDAHFA